MSSTAIDEMLMMEPLRRARMPGITCLQVMTMHKSKGLQFDHVVLYGLGRTARTGAKAVLSKVHKKAIGGGVARPQTTKHARGKLLRFQLFAKRL